jgi:Uma2 family endonuclease
MIAKTLMTAEEFEAIAASLGPCELVRGEVVCLSPGGMRHSGIAATVTGLLFQWVGKSRLGRLFSDEAGIVVEADPDTVRGADVAYLSYQRLPRGQRPEGFGRTPPELVVEIVGKGQGWREMVEKAGEYLRMGVDRVWVIEPSSRRLHVFRPDAEPVILAATDRIEDGTILPGFSCTVGEFFED